MGYLVYKHTTPSKKVYIGITSRTAHERWREGEGYKGSYFYNAVKKYGWDNIQHEILFENLTQEEAIAKENELITKYDSINRDKGYNVVPGGGLGIKGYKFTDEQVKRLSESHKGVWTEKQQQAAMARRGKPSPCKGKKQSRESIEKMRRSLIEHYKTNKVSEETREKLRKANGGENHWNYGRKYSDEMRFKLSKAHLGQKPVTRKKVICLETKEVFDSERDATLAKGYKKDAIGAVCRGNKHTVDGNHWMFLDDYKNSSEEDIKQRFAHNYRSKKVICVETGEIYNSGQAASRSVGASSNAVTMCCRGLTPTIKGYHWRFFEEVT